MDRLITDPGALLADIWDTDHRGQAMSIFALAPFAGPSIGPIVAGFIGVSGTVSGTDLDGRESSLTSHLGLEMGVLDPNDFFRSLPGHYFPVRSRDVRASAFAAQGEAIEEDDWRAKVVRAL